ncbi:putative ribonuclease H-like domain-containing protein [Tanacetum coccineum]|uniref:Ribonuclease H-like domain-containing protein n=1 Tax=Tanacetum coccineum TaxID=301880 RepID=A0ABQ4ZWA8_9ASTR
MVYRNKKDERGVVVRNKARLVAQGHRQEEGINYDEVFAPVARIEAIRIFLAFASYMGFIVYQMDVKSAFLYRKIDKEVYVSQPPGFIDPKYPKKVYKVVKALYGLHQAPRAWYATLSTFLLKNGYRRGTIDKTLFIKKDKNDIIKPVYSTPKQSNCLGHHFIRDAYEKKLIQVLKIHTDDNVADLLTKAFDCAEAFLTISDEFQEVNWVLKSYWEEIKTALKDWCCQNSVEHYSPQLAVVLESCPKHNMVAYLEKTDGNAEFHEIIDFLARSSIHNALTVSPVVSTTFVEQFWMSAKSKIINNVRYITAKVAGKPVSISEASIRSDLLFDDADGIDSLPNQAIFDAIQLMGYEGDLTVLTFNKALFSPQWRFLFHTMNHCISSKSTSWDQIPTNIATAVICLTSNQKYNFSKLIFDGMLRHLDAKKKFVMYPRFISIFLDKQLMNVPVPLDHFPVNALTSKVFSFMVKKGKHFLGKVTPLFASMLVQPTEDEGATSERPSEPQPTLSPPHPSEANIEPQSDPSPRSSPTTHIPDSIQEDSGGNHRGQSSSDKSLSGNEGDMTLPKCYMNFVSLCVQELDEECIFEAKIGRKENFEGKLDAKLLDDTMDYMDTEDAQDMGRTREVVNEEKETVNDEVSTEDVFSTAQQKVSTDRPNISTDRPKHSTDKEKEGTDKEKDSTISTDEDTVDQTEGRRATPTTPTTTPTIEKEKGVELKDVEETKRQRPTSTRSLLTLKPLPKIDPKDKGKKKIKEEDEFETESEGIPEAEKKFKQLARDEEMARKLQED